MIQRVHRVGAIAALLLVLALWTATTCSAFLAGSDTQVTVVRLVMYSGFALVPVVVLTGTSGHFAAGARRPPRIRAKRHRMPYIGAPCLALTAPSGYALDHLAQAGDLGTAFQVLRSAEVVATTIVAGLMVLSARDGLALSVPKRRALRARAQRTTQPESVDTTL